MTLIKFDTHGIFKKLKSVGFDEEQANLIEDKLVTKNDLIELGANFRRDMKELEYRIIIKMGSLMAIQIGVIAVLVKLL